MFGRQNVPKLRLDLGLQGRQLPPLIRGQVQLFLGQWRQQVDDMVVVTGGSSDTGPALLAYKRTDGAPVWRAGTGKASYVTPMLVTLAGRRQILTVNASTVTGHDPAMAEFSGNTLG